jgi:hypothetical protein
MKIKVNSTNTNKEIKEIIRSLHSTLQLSKRVYLPKPKKVVLLEGLKKKKVFIFKKEKIEDTYKRKVKKIIKIL